jgi:hypothetical protein
MPSGLSREGNIQQRFSDLPLWPATCGFIARRVAYPGKQSRWVCVTALAEHIRTQAIFRGCLPMSATNNSWSVFRLESGCNTPIATQHSVCARNSWVSQCNDRNALERLRIKAFQSVSWPRR